MKKIGIIGVILISLFFPNLVKADTYDIRMQDYYSIPAVGGSNGAPYLYTNFYDFISDNNRKQIFDEVYNNVMENYEEIKEQYPYYTIGVTLESKKNNEWDEYLIMVYMVCGSENEKLDFYQSEEISGKKIVAIHYDGTYYNDFIYDNSDGIGNIVTDIQEATDIRGLYIDLWVASNFTPVMGGYLVTWNPTNCFETNIQENYDIGDTVRLYNANNELIESYASSDISPFLYSNGNNYNPNNTDKMKEVNLDNYNYIILTLKNYNITEPFETTLEVLGQVGITPVYNYGQTSKDEITGVKVQDRCNIDYENFTKMQLYILKQDIQNNVVYIVKKCKNGSKIKYNSELFNVFYVTNENKDDPVITINGNEYHTIPFDDLPSTANKNEEENYIPGESGGANSEGGLSGALKSIQQKMSEIWDIITFFAGFVNQMFSILPEPIKIVLMSAFAIAITLGLIKIFIN